MSTILDSHRARGASLLRCHMRAPWALRIEDGAAVGIIVMVSGAAWLTPGTGGPIRLEAGDVAVAKGPTPYRLADAPSTAPTIVIEPGNVCRSLTGEHLALSMGLGTRTWGNADSAPDDLLAPGDGGPPSDAAPSGPVPSDGAAPGIGPVTTFLSATWELASQVTGRLLDSMPPVGVVRAGELDPALADLLAREVGRELPGQDVVLDRLVDLVLVSAVRQWFARPGSQAPAWWTARSDPVVGRALALIHDEPASDWSLERLAGEVHVSRATLSRRFTELVGVSPMAYVSQWRLATAADLLRSGSGSVEQIAGLVGYASPFAFSAAFRREHGLSPRAYRAASAPGATSPVDGAPPANPHGGAGGVDGSAGVQADAPETGPGGPQRAGLAQS
ncbi:AraC family transcriptional regulator [Intrasporangium mesophilum]